MKTVNNKYKFPILSENRNFRKELPQINAHFEMAKKETESFPKENGVIVDPHYVTYVNCPICNSDKDDQMFLKYGFLFTECSMCSHVFVKNQLNENILMDLYRNSEADKLDREVQRSSQHQEYWKKVYDKYLNYFSDLSVENENLLDIGSGAGMFLQCCKNKTKYALHAIDFCEDSYFFIADLIGKENYFFNKKFEDVNFGAKKFGIITMWGVFEHVANPKEILAKCYQVLDKNGFVLLLIPNIFSRAFKILGIKTPTLNPREHINFYTDKSFKQLCADMNFRIIDCFEELPVIDLMYEHIDFNDELIEDIVNKGESYYKVYVIGKSGRSIVTKEF